MTRILDLLFWPYRILFRWVQLIRNAVQEVSGAMMVCLLFGISATLVAAWFFWPDHEPLADTDFDSATESAWVPASLGFMAVSIFSIVHCFLIKSQRQHLRFALALPARRWELYLSRIIGVWIAQAVVLLLLYAFGSFLLSLTEISTMPGRWKELLEETTRSDVVIAFLMTGVLVGLTATRLAFPWLVILWMLGSEIFPSSLKWLSLEAMDIFTDGDSSVIDWELARKVIPLSLFGYFVGYLGYRPKEGAVADGTSVFGSIRRWFYTRRRSFLATTTIALLTAAAVLVWNSDAASRAHSETSKLVFSFDEEDESLLSDLMDEGDAIYAEVSEFFDITDDEQKIGVVITDVFDGTGVGGVANWKTVRLARNILEGEVPFMEPAEVLRHELAHVFLELHGEGKLREYGGNVKAFHEGVATLSESLPNREVMNDFQRHRLIMAAVKESWWPLEFEDLLAFEGGNIGRHGGMVAYSHGFILAQAIVEAFGEEAPTEIAKASSRLKAASVLYNTEAFWRLLLNEAGYSYEKLQQAYKKRLREVGEENATYVKAMPLPKGKVRWDEDAAVIVHNGEAEDGATFVVSVNEIPNYPEGKEPKDDEPADVLEEMLAVFRANDQGEVRIPLERFEEHEEGAHYIVGWAHTDLEMPILSRGGWLNPQHAEKSNALRKLLRQSRYASLVSAPGKKAHNLKLENQSGSTVEIYRLDAEQHLWPEGRISDDATRRYRAKENSVWIAVNSKGKIVETAQMPSEDHHLEINTNTNASSKK